MGDDHALGKTAGAGGVDEVGGGTLTPQPPLPRERGSRNRALEDRDGMPYLAAAAGRTAFSRVNRPRVPLRQRAEV